MPQSLSEKQQNFFSEINYQNLNDELNESDLKNNISNYILKLAPGKRTKKFREWLAAFHTDRTVGKSGLVDSKKADTIFRIINSVKETYSDNNEVIQENELKKDEEAVKEKFDEINRKYSYSYFNKNLNNDNIILQEHKEKFEKSLNQKKAPFFYNFLDKKSRNIKELKSNIDQIKQLISSHEEEIKKLLSNINHLSWKYAEIDYKLDNKVTESSQLYAEQMEEKLLIINHITELNSDRKKLEEELIKLNQHKNLKGDELKELEDLLEKSAEQLKLLQQKLKKEEEEEKKEEEEEGLEKKKNYEQNQKEYSEINESTIEEEIKRFNGICTNLVSNHRNHFLQIDSSNYYNNSYEEFDKQVLKELKESWNYPIEEENLEERKLEDRFTYVFTELRRSIDNLFNDKKITKQQKQKLKLDLWNGRFLSGIDEIVSKGNRGFTIFKNDLVRMEVPLGGKIVHITSEENVKNYFKLVLENCGINFNLSQVSLTDQEWQEKDCGVLFFNKLIELLEQTNEPGLAEKLNRFKTYCRNFHQGSIIGANVTPIFEHFNYIPISSNLGNVETQQSAHEISFSNNTDEQSLLTTTTNFNLKFSDRNTGNSVIFGNLRTTIQLNLDTGELKITGSQCQYNLEWVKNKEVKEFLKKELKFLHKQKTFTLSEASRGQAQSWHLQSTKEKLESFFSREKIQNPTNQLAILQLLRQRSKFLAFQSITKELRENSNLSEITNIEATIKSLFPVNEEDWNNISYQLFGNKNDNHGQQQKEESISDLAHFLDDERPWPIDQDYIQEISQPQIQIRSIFSRSKKPLQTQSPNLQKIGWHKNSKAPVEIRKSAQIAILQSFFKKIEANNEQRNNIIRALRELTTETKIQSLQSQLCFTPKQLALIEPDEFQQLQIAASSKLGAAFGGEFTESVKNQSPIIQANQLPAYNLAKLLVNDCGIKGLEVQKKVIEAFRSNENTLQRLETINELSTQQLEKINRHQETLQTLAKQNLGTVFEDSFNSEINKNSTNTPSNQNKRISFALNKTRYAQIQPSQSKTVIPSVALKHLLEANGIFEEEEQKEIIKAIRGDGEDGEEEQKGTTQQKSIRLSFFQKLKNKIPPQKLNSLLEKETFEALCKFSGYGLGSAFLGGGFEEEVKIRKDSEQSQKNNGQTFPPILLAQAEQIYFNFLQNFSSGEDPKNKVILAQNKNFNKSFLEALSTELTDQENKFIKNSVRSRIPKGSQEEIDEKLKFAKFEKIAHQIEETIASVFSQLNLNNEQEAKNFLREAIYNSLGDWLIKEAHEDLPPRLRRATVETSDFNGSADLLKAALMPKRFIESFNNTLQEDEKKTFHENLAFFNSPEINQLVFHENSQQKSFPITPALRLAAIENRCKNGGVQENINYQLFGSPFAISKEQLLQESNESGETHLGYPNYNETDNLHPSKLPYTSFAEMERQKPILALNQFFRKVEIKNEEQQQALVQAVKISPTPQAFTENLHILTKPFLGQEKTLIDPIFSEKQFDLIITNLTDQILTFLNQQPIETPKIANLPPLQTKLQTKPKTKKSTSSNLTIDQIQNLSPASFLRQSFYPYPPSIFYQMLVRAISQGYDPDEFKKEIFTASTSGTDTINQKIQFWKTNRILTEVEELKFLEQIAIITGYASSNELRGDYLGLTSRPKKVIFDISKTKKDLERTKIIDTFTSFFDQKWLEENIISIIAFEGTILNGKNAKNFEQYKQSQIEKFQNIFFEVMRTSAAGNQSPTAAHLALLLHQKLCVEVNNETGSSLISEESLFNLLKKLDDGLIKKFREDFEKEEYKNLIVNKCLVSCSTPNQPTTKKSIKPAKISFSHEDLKQRFLLETKIKDVPNKINLDQLTTDLLSGYNSQGTVTQALEEAYKRAHPNQTQQAKTNVTRLISQAGDVYQAFIDFSKTEEAINSEAIRSSCTEDTLLVSELMISIQSNNLEEKAIALNKLREYAILTSNAEEQAKLKKKIKTSGYGFNFSDVVNLVGPSKTTLDRLIFSIEETASEIIFESNKSPNSHAEDLQQQSQEEEKEEEEKEEEEDNKSNQKNHALLSTKIDSGTLLEPLHLIRILCLNGYTIGEIDKHTDKNILTTCRGPEILQKTGESEKEWKERFLNYPATEKNFDDFRELINVASAVEYVEKNGMRIYFANDGSTAYGGQSNLETRMNEAVENAGPNGKASLILSLGGGHFVCVLINNDEQTIPSCVVVDSQNSDANLDHQAARLITQAGYNVQQVITGASKPNLSQEGNSCGVHACLNAITFLENDLQNILGEEEGTRKAKVASIYDALNNFLQRQELYTPQELYTRQELYTIKLDNFAKTLDEYKKKLSPLEKETSFFDQFKESVNIVSQHYLGNKIFSLKKDIIESEIKAIEDFNEKITKQQKEQTDNDNELTITNQSTDNQTRKDFELILTNIISAVSLDTSLATSDLNQQYLISILERIGVSFNNKSIPTKIINDAKKQIESCKGIIEKLEDLFDILKEGLEEKVKQLKTEYDRMFNNNQEESGENNQEEIEEIIMEKTESKKEIEELNKSAKFLRKNPSSISPQLQAWKEILTPNQKTKPTGSNNLAQKEKGPDLTNLSKSFFCFL